MSKVKLQQLLTERLALIRPTFQLKRIGSTVSGSIISETFRGKSDRQRLHMLWSALDAELGDQSYAKVGMLIAYTPEEWDVPEAPAEKRGKR